jgi:hypothetical protein
MNLVAKLLLLYDYTIDTLFIQLAAPNTPNLLKLGRNQLDPCFPEQLKWNRPYFSIGDPLLLVEAAIA